jgi:hypothetical protein
MQPSCGRWARRLKAIRSAAVAIADQAVRAAEELRQANEERKRGAAGPD